MSAKHTQGPWEVRHFNGVGVFAVNNPAGNDSTNYPIVDFGNVGGTRLTEFAHYGTPEANARLIAAAPELLALAHKVADNVVLAGMDIGAQARAAIAAATGEPA